MIKNFWKYPCNLPPVPFVTKKETIKNTKGGIHSYCFFMVSPIHNRDYSLFVHMFIINAYYKGDINGIWSFRKEMLRNCKKAKGLVLYFTKLSLGFVFIRNPVRDSSLFKTVFLFFSRLVCDFALFKLDILPMNGFAVVRKEHGALFDDCFHMDRSTP